VDVRQKEMKFLDLTSLTGEEFDQLVPIFEESFQKRMSVWCLDGKKRIKRRYTTYENCPLPTAEDRLLFILVYLKTNVLQVVQGELFDMPQNKTNQWIHALLPALQETLRTLGDAPARSMEQLSQRLNRIISSDQMTVLPDSITPPLKEEKADQDQYPLFAMMGPNDEFSVPKIKMNRKAIIAARKNVTR
jgi:hypothetical protein